MSTPKPALDDPEPIDPRYIREAAHWKWMWNHPEITVWRLTLGFCIIVIVILIIILVNLGGYGWVLDSAARPNRQRTY